MAALVGRYVEIGALVQVMIEMTWGSTTNGGTGALLFSLPKPSAGANYQMPGKFLDSSAGALFLTQGSDAGEIAAKSMSLRRRKRCR